MDIEDSYEGAAHRLRRLGYAGVDLAPPPEPAQESDDDSGRMRDLEELATIACDENERLKQELEGVSGESERLARLVATLQETLADAQSEESSTAEEHQRLAQENQRLAQESQQLMRQLDCARGENERVQRLTVTLQEMLASAQSEESSSGDSEQLTRQLDGAHAEIRRLQQLVATLQEGLSSSAPSDDDDEQLLLPKSRVGSRAVYVAIAAVGGVAALWLMLRPGDSRPLPAVTAAAAQPFVASTPVVTVPVVTAPVVTAPAVAKIEPPKVEPTVPKVAATIPKVAPKVAAATRSKAQRRHPAKHVAKVARHDEKKRASAARSTKIESRGDDPLSGLNL